MYYGRSSADSFLAFCAVIIGVLLYVFFHTKAGQITIWTVAILGVCVIIGKLFLIDVYYEKFSINYVSKEFVVNKTTIRNRSCTVIFTPNQKIMVMDNDYMLNDSKRMFTIKKNEVKLNQMWNKVCKFFDEASNVDSLAAFCTLDTNIEIITFATKPVKEKPLIQESSIPVENIESKEESKEVLKEDFKEDIEKEPVVANEGKHSKIDVNKASADEISALPGVNIVKAKKIVEYRNLNGLFKNEDEFLKALQVKEYFIPKIKKMIVVKIDDKPQKDNNYEEGRIVDL